MKHSRLQGVRSGVVNSKWGRRACNFLSGSVVPGPHALFFHGVEERLIDERIQVVQIRLDQLQALVEALQKKFCLIDFDEYCERSCSGWDNLDRCIMLTFDDGYESVHRVAAPYLRSKGIPFTVYLTTSAIDTQARIPTFVARASMYLTRESVIRLPGDELFSLRSESEKDYAVSKVVKLLKSQNHEGVDETVCALRSLLSEAEWDEVNHRFQSDAFMNWDQVKDLRENGGVVGAHGHEHIPLHSGLSIEEVTRQVVKSTELVKRHIGYVDHYAYPNGTIEDIGPLALNALSEIGYKSAVTTFGSSIPKGCDPLLIPRICCYDIEGFENRIIRNWVQRRPQALRLWQESLRMDLGPRD